MGMSMDIRVGLGVDAHRLGPGVDQPDALPVTNREPLVDQQRAQAEGASGRLLLGIVMQRVRQAGFAVVNAHVVIMCERPRISRYRDAMEDALSAVVGARVTVHATTTEQMGALGRGEGIGAQAVALLNGDGRTA